MKKLIFPILIIILLLCSCTSEIVESGGVVVRAKTTKSAEKAIEPQKYAEKDIVFITKSGTKYHKEGCSYISSSKIPMLKEQAINEGIEPCSKCYPPQ